MYHSVNLLMFETAGANNKCLVQDPNASDNITSPVKIGLSGTRVGNNWRDSLSK